MPFLSVSPYKVVDHRAQEEEALLYSLPHVQLLGVALLDSAGIGKLFQWAYIYIQGSNQKEKKTKKIKRETLKLERLWVSRNPLQASLTPPFGHTNIQHFTAHYTVQCKNPTYNLWITTHSHYGTALSAVQWLWGSRALCICVIYGYPKLGVTHALRSTISVPAPTRFYYYCTSIGTMPCNYWQKAHLRKLVAWP